MNEEKKQQLLCSFWLAFEFLCILFIVIEPITGFLTATVCLCFAYWRCTKYIEVAFTPEWFKSCVQKHLDAKN